MERGEEYPQDQESPAYPVRDIEDNEVPVPDEELVIDIHLDDILFLQKSDDNTQYGFYLLDRAGHQYLYAFIQSRDEGITWDIIYRFSPTSEIYYGVFLDQDLGFVNFGSTEELSLFMTTNGGLTWKMVQLDFPEKEKGMLFVQSIEKKGEEIQLNLGYPAWSISMEKVSFFSVNKGLSWESR